MTTFPIPMAAAARSRAAAASVLGKVAWDLATVTGDGVPAAADVLAAIRADAANRI